MEEKVNQEEQKPLGSQHQKTEDEKPNIEYAEPPFRLNCKETSKGTKYYEYTIKAQTPDELEELNSRMRKYIAALKRKDNGEESEHTPTK